VLDCRPLSLPELERTLEESIRQFEHISSDFGMNSSIVVQHVKVLLFAFSIKARFDIIFEKIGCPTTEADNCPSFLHHQ
jgi:hypothetical protein